MKEQMLYVCEICGTAYSDKKKAEEREADGKKKTGICHEAQEGRKTARWQVDTILIQMNDVLMTSIFC